MLIGTVQQLKERKVAGSMSETFLGWELGRCTGFPHPEHGGGGRAGKKSQEARLAWWKTAAGSDRFRWEDKVSPRAVNLKQVENRLMDVDGLSLSADWENM